jgi:hypothetical protein
MQDHRTIIDYNLQGSRLELFLFFLCFYGPIVLKNKNNKIKQLLNSPGPLQDHCFDGPPRSWCGVLS